MPVFTDLLISQNKKIPPQKHYASMRRFFISVKDIKQTRQKTEYSPFYGSDFFE
jgi:hypothetical protein